MRVKVDEGICVGCGLCVDTCPEVFQFKKDDDSVVEPKSSEVPIEFEDKVKEATDNCPVTAIEYE